MRADQEQFEITVDASGNADALDFAISSTAPNGVCTSVAIYFGPTPVPLTKMYGKGITFITGRVHARAGGALVEPLADAIGAIDRARELLDLDVEGLVGRQVGLPRNAADTRTVNDDQLRCTLFGRPERPACCAGLQPATEMCGESRAHALRWLDELETLTRPG